MLDKTRNSLRGEAGYHCNGLWIYAMEVDFYLKIGIPLLVTAYHGLSKTWYGWKTLQKESIPMPELKNYSKTKLI